MSEHTIAAKATPNGEGGVSIIRISGEQAVEIAQKVFFPKHKKNLAELSGYRAAFGELRSVDGEFIDQAVAVVFKAPKSYTAEDVVELQCHAGQAVSDAVLRAVLDSGAVLAEPGEFTKRAFLNGRISLSEAEGIASLISAQTKQAGKAAAALMNGAMYKEMSEITAKILDLETHLSAALDFPEEDIEPVDEQYAKELLGFAQNRLAILVENYDAGMAVLNGVTATIAGAPNVGKSTVMNLLSGFEKAIVTEKAGTTRDVIEQRINIGGTTLILSDTAGIRDKTDDQIEAIGIDRAKEKIEQSSLVIAVFDNSKQLCDGDIKFINSLKDKNVVALVNKSDLEGNLDIEVVKQNFANVGVIQANDLSSKETIERLVSAAVGTNNLSPEVPILANERQRTAARNALLAVTTAIKELENKNTYDIVYDILEQALEYLYELSGQNVSSTVIDEVFSKFCVGK